MLGNEAAIGFPWLNDGYPQTTTTAKNRKGGLRTFITIAWGANRFHKAEVGRRFCTVDTDEYPPRGPFNLHKKTAAVHFKGSAPN